MYIYIYAGRVLIKREEVFAIVIMEGFAECSDRTTQILFLSSFFHVMFYFNKS